MSTRWVPLLSATVLTAGCTLAPAYHPPAVESAPPAYREAGDWIVAQPADDRSRGDWWAAFDDPLLKSLEERATAANQDLKAAYARLEQARAATRVARSALLPTITVVPMATRYRTSVNSPAYSPAKSAVGNDFVLGADLSYELDLWGRVRSLVSAARANERASAGDYASFRLGLQAEVAIDYFALRSADARQGLLDRTVDDYGRAAGLTRNLYRGGAASLGDQEQAEAQLHTAEAEAADNQLQRAQLEHALATLVGESASTWRFEAASLPVAAAPPALDPGLPSTLLERRPDVAAAERRVAAANAGIGAARAAYFPLFSIGGTVGQESTSSSTWMNAPSRLWSAGASAALTVFDAGRHRAQSQAAHAAFDEAVADYRGTVLRAYQEVEDELAALRQLAIESAREEQAVRSTQIVLEQAEARYRAGVVTYLEVVATENAALGARLAAYDIQLRRLTASVALIKALGGGWTSAG